MDGLRRAGGLTAQAQLLWRATSQPRKKLLIDFSSPNVAKQFHVGNLRSTLIGRFIDKAHRNLGDDVTSLNYLGDWGTQFALIAAYWPQNRPSDAFWTKVSDDEKMKLIQQCYVVANKMLTTEGDFRVVVRDTYKKMEDFLVKGVIEDEVMLLWRDIRSLSERHLAHFYKLLDITFDKTFFESDEVAGARKVIDELVQKGLLWVVEMEKKNAEGKEEYSIVKKSDDTTLYLTRDVASILRRDKLFGADRYLYVVDRAQKRHFEEIGYVLGKMGRRDLADKIEHVIFGRVQGLSTRLGKTEAVTDVIERGSELARQYIKSSPTAKVKEEEIAQLSRVLALDAITVNTLKRARASEYEFTFKNAFALNQNNALLLQEKYSRLCSIEAKNAELLPKLDEDSRISEDEGAKQLIDFLNATPGVLVESARRMEPCQLTVHLIQLAHHIGRAIANQKVSGESIDVAVPRLRLLLTARQVLADGMTLLGLKPTKEM
ncbi:unnamed protein product, partial [Mesorhabditis belari]|uniref:Probable arginine--tRNA ligase, mitochondrial n=1 Tax=Mesorhabditis belari TaxID=2138241 RepID=A0AAF3EYI2_9BILA